MHKRLLHLFAILMVLAPMSAAAADKELRMPLISAPPTLGNPFGGVGPPSSFVWNALFDTLVTPGKTGDLEPALALSWKAVEPTRWRFNLRPGIKFSNGEPFDATAVVTTLQWLISDAGKRTVVGGEVSNMTQVAAVDPLTVDVITDRPDAILPKRLTAVSIIAPQAFTTLGIDGFAQTPVGTGPFVLKTWKQGGGRIVVEANRTSWRKPMIDRIIFTVVADPTARIQSLASGQIDLVIPVSPDQAAQFEGTDFKTIITPTAQVYGFGFVTTQAKNKSHTTRRRRRRCWLKPDMPKDSN